MDITHNLQPGDIGQIVYQHGQLYAKEHGYDFTFEAYVAEPLAQFAKRTNSRERIWLAKQGEKIIGSICICQFSNTTAQLRWFFVGPEARGCGLGKRLLDDAISFCVAQRYSQINLWTVKGLDAAKSLYLRNGFALSEEKTHKVWGSVHTEQQYTKKL